MNQYIIAQPIFFQCAFSLPPWKHHQKIVRFSDVFGGGRETVHSVQMGNILRLHIALESHVEGKSYLIFSVISILQQKIGKLGKVWIADA